MLLNEEAQKKLSAPNHYTLILEFPGDISYTIRQQQAIFLLAYATRYHPSQPLLQESDWARFLAQLPDELKTSNCWRAM